MQEDSGADLPVELVLKEACPERVFIHDSRHIGHEGSVHMRLLRKDLLHTFRSHLIPHLLQQPTCCHLVKWEPMGSQVAPWSWQDDVTAFKHAQNKTHLLQGSWGDRSTADVDSGNSMITGPCMPRTVFVLPSALGLIASSIALPTPALCFCAPDSPCCLRSRCCRPAQNSCSEMLPDCLTSSSNKAFRSLHKALHS